MKHTPIIRRKDDRSTFIEQHQIYALPITLGASSHLETEWPLQFKNRVWNLTDIQKAKEEDKEEFIHSVLWNHNPSLALSSLKDKQEKNKHQRIFQRTFLCSVNRGTH